MNKRYLSTVSLVAVSLLMVFLALNMVFVIPPVVAFVLGMVAIFSAFFVIGLLMINN